MSIHQIYRTQKLPIQLSEAWNFFSNPQNLKVITPQYLNFVIQTKLDDQTTLYPGMIIIYSINPILNVPLTWATEITYIEKEKYFIDEQRIGPYAFWHHQHTFKLLKNGLGIEMEDLVHYQLRFNFLGNLMHKIWVKHQLEEIFDYRKKKLEEIFGHFE